MPSKPDMTDQPKTIDEYLATLNEEQRTALENLRKAIRSAAPRADECISYQLPTFRQNGMLVSFGATANHLALYVMSASTLAAHKNELGGYETSKGSIRFQPEKPIPAALVKKIVKARIAENETVRESPGAKPVAKSSAKPAAKTAAKPSAKADGKLTAKQSVKPGAKLK